MKIVEIIVLMGAQCVSPMQHSPKLTEVTKVECAVVIEKDSLTNRMEVSPPAAAGHPTVSAAIARLARQQAPNPEVAASAQGFTIVPAAARASAPLPAAAPPKLPELIPLPVEPSASAIPSAALVAAPETQQQSEVASLPASQEKPAAEPEPEMETENLAAPEKQQKKAASSGTAKASKKTAVKPADRCMGTARAKWYTNKQGHRKYRCVSSAAPAKAGPKSSRVARAQKGLY